MEISYLGDLFLSYHLPFGYRERKAKKSRRPKRQGSVERCPVATVTISL
jgi:hypothetical protein